MVEKEKKVRVQKKCKQCNKPFSLTAEHIRWLNERGLVEMEYCKACREARRVMTNSKYGKF